MTIGSPENIKNQPVEEIEFKERIMTPDEIIEDNLNWQRLLDEEEGLIEDQYPSQKLLRTTYGPGSSIPGIDDDIFFNI